MRRPEVADRCAKVVRTFPRGGRGSAGSTRSGEVPAVGPGGCGGAWCSTLSRSGARTAGDARELAGGGASDCQAGGAGDRPGAVSRVWSPVRDGYGLARPWWPGFVDDWWCAGALALGVCGAWVVGPWARPAAGRAHGWGRFGASGPPGLGCRLASRLAPWSWRSAGPWSGIAAPEVARDGSGAAGGRRGTTFGGFAWKRWFAAGRPRLDALMRPGPGPRSAWPWAQTRR